ncbi:MAG TPA: response regulator, partial [Pyrinomonadaceae bacterium]|nr:response regulator [Pyrinomonadaceae bacterium]
EPPIRVLIEGFLRGAGYQVVSTGEPREALDLAKRESPDLVISDISMPEMDGYQLLQQLRRLPQMVNVPALALTGFGRVSDVDRAHREGFTKHFTKPLDIDKLLDSVRELTRGNGTRIAPTLNV